MTCSVDEWRERCRAWLDGELPRKVSDGRREWGVGSDDVSVFHDLTPSAERTLLDHAMAWQRRRYDAGFGAISWPVDAGGAGLSAAHERAYEEEEHDFVTPPGHETLSVTVGLIAPTVLLYGTPGQRDQFLRRFRRAEELCCQLFSEPTAGSDLADLSTRAVRDGDTWRIDGQKVWSSGAQFSGWGELIARTDPDAPKHAGLTAFLVPMDSPGIEVRPIKQMSGGSSFCEVFLTDVRLPDALRLGEVGQGWRVALATLGFEREHSGTEGVGGSWEQLLALARHVERTDDPLVRQDLARVYVGQRLRQLNAERAGAAARAGQAPGPEGSIGKLQWVQGMLEIGEVASRLLGPALTADTGAWGTYAWSRHVLGAPGYRIAGGSDEIQRNIIGERVLGLPPEPRLDRNRPWRDR
jgi:alkylation response protein AidB-like acyl-CoA dehydrogenase